MSYYRNSECIPVHERGIALITVLWVTALIAIIVGSVSGAVRSETRVVGSQIAGLQARNAAEGGIHLAAYHLMQTIPEQRWPADGTVREEQIGQAHVRIAIIDEAGKVDLNFSQAGLLRNLLEAVDIEQDRVDSLVDAILDWRDSDDFHRLNGAEEEDYRMAGLDYGPKNAQFDSVEELRLVLGMDNALFLKLKGAVTVLSKQAAVNPRVAPREVLLALTNNDAVTVDAYLALREANRESGLPPPPAPVTARTYLSAAGGKVYTVYVEANMENRIYKKSSATLITHRNLPETPVEFLMWRDSGIPLFNRGTKNADSERGA